MAYKRPMAKTSPVGVRLQPLERAILEAAAASDHRPLASMIHKILVEWIERSKKEGSLPVTATAARGK